MKTRRWLVAASLLVTLLAVAWCLRPGGAPAPPGEQVEERAEESSGHVVPGSELDPHEPGAERVYALEFETETSREGAQVYAMKGVGRFVLTVAERRGTGTLVAARLEAPELEILAEGTPVAPPAATLDHLASPFFLSVDPSGRITALRVPDDLDPSAQLVLQGISSALQFVRPAHAGRSWELEEQDHIGRCRAHYEQSQPTRFHKVKRDYRLASGWAELPDSSPPLYRGDADYVRRPDGVIESAAVRERSESRVMGTTFQGSTRYAFELETIRRSQLSAQRLREASSRLRPVSIDHKPGSIEEARGARARELVQGADLDGLLDALDRAETESERWAVEERLAAWFRLHPADVRVAIEWIERLELENAQMLLTAFGEAMNPEGQRALASVSAGNYPELLVRNAIVHLGLHARPSAETIAALARLVDDPTREARVREMSYLSLASAAGTATQGDSADARSAGQQVIERLELEYQSADRLESRQRALGALGNSGHARSLDLLAQAASDPSPAVRSDAVFALRGVEGSRAEELISTAMIGDEDPEVRASAVQALRYRAPNEGIERSLANALLAESSSAIRRRILGLLAFQANGPPSDQLRPALEWIAANDVDADVRADAGHLLSSPSPGPTSR